jgi:serine/threonine protein kinase
VSEADPRPEVTSEQASLPPLSPSELESPSPSTVPELPQVPGYELLDVLGRGGMGVVYKARQVKAGRIVALKMILAGGHADVAMLARFRTEAEAVARLQHPNIVQVFEVGDHDGLPFFSLEFCPGGSLDAKLNGTPLPPTETAQLVETLARAMHAAHNKGIIHRDLKPANVLLASFDSYACRKGKGTHAGVRRCQQYCRRHAWVWKAEVRKFFPSIDHQILKVMVGRKILDPDVMWLVNLLIDHSNPQVNQLLKDKPDDADLKKRRDTAGDRITKADYIQVKASDTLQRLGTDFVFDLDLRDYNLWRFEPMPVILILFDASRRRGVWIWVQDYFATATTRQPRRGAKTVRVRVPERQAFNRRAVRTIRRLKQEACDRLREESRRDRGNLRPFG